MRFIDEECTCYIGFVVGVGDVIETRLIPAPTPMMQRRCVINALRRVWVVPMLAQRCTKNMVSTSKNGYDGVKECAYQLAGSSDAPAACGEW